MGVGLCRVFWIVHDVRRVGSQAPENLVLDEGKEVFAVEFFFEIAELIGIARGVLLGVGMAESLAHVLVVHHVECASKCFVTPARQIIRHASHLLMKLEKV